MKRWIIGSAISLGISLLAMGAVYTNAAVGRRVGVQFGSMGSPEAAFPVAVGFGSMILAAISLTLFLVLILAALIRPYFPRATTGK